MATVSKVKTFNQLLEVLQEQADLISSLQKEVATLKEAK